MGIPWKKIGSVLLGLGKSGLIPIPGLPAMIDGVEHAFEKGPGGQGATKLDIVSALSDVALAESIALEALTPEQAAQLHALKVAYISDYVSAKNLEAKIESDALALKAFIVQLKTEHPATPPVEG